MVETHHSRVRVRCVIGVSAGCGQEAVVFSCKVVYSSGAWQKPLGWGDPWIIGSRLMPCLALAQECTLCCRMTMARLGVGALKPAASSSLEVVFHRPWPS